MLSSLHRELLSPTGMANARDYIVRRHSWFLHVSYFNRLEKISSEGLLPKNPDEEMGGSPIVDPCIAKIVGDFAAYIVCMRPIFSSVNTRPMRQENQFLLAISNSDLPARIGIDWSYDSCMELADHLHEGGASASAAFARVACDRGSLVSYDPIPAGALRVWVEGCLQIDPAKWPRLKDADLSRVAVMKPGSAMDA